MTLVLRSRGFAHVWVNLLLEGSVIVRLPELQGLLAVATTQDLLSLARQMRGMGREVTRLSKDDLRAEMMTIVAMQIEHIAMELIEISKSKAVSPRAASSNADNRDAITD